MSLWIIVSQKRYSFTEAPKIIELIILHIPCTWTYNEFNQAYPNLCVWKLSDIWSPTKSVQLSSRERLQQNIFSKAWPDIIRMMYLIKILNLGLGSMLLGLYFGTEHMYSIIFICSLNLFQYFLYSYPATERFVRYNLRYEYHI